MVGPAVHNAARSPSTRDGSYVDWPCAMAGAVTAAAISFVLLTFGSGIGLSIVSPWSGSGLSIVAFAVLTSFWALVAQLSAFAAGGYLAGRMRRPWSDARPEEVEFRDGVHGALVWAVGVAFGALLFASAVAGTTRTVASVGNGAASSSSMSESSIAFIDTLFRSTRAAQPDGSTAYRAEAGRILVAGTGRSELPAADRTYLAQLVAARTGLSQPEAEQRVDQVITSAKMATDRARKAGIVAAFLAAATLLAGCAAAWSAAQLGGMHRDQGLIWRGFARHQRITLRGVAPRV
jgi:hypothetical protein